MKKPLLVAVLATLAAPAIAHAGDVSLRVQEVPLGRAPAAAPREANFNLLGLHWMGSGTVAYRTRTLHGHWRRWHNADADNRSGVQQRFTLMNRSGQSKSAAGSAASKSKVMTRSGAR